LPTDTIRPGFAPKPHKALQKPRPFCKRQGHEHDAVAKELLLASGKNTFNEIIPGFAVNSPISWKKSIDAFYN